MEARRNKSKKREAILSALLATDTHPTAEMLYEGLKNRIPELSLGTVYRNLSILEEEGRVRSVSHEGGHAHYDARTDAHAHFVCRICLSVKDVELPGLGAELGAELERATGCSVESQSICFRGVCEKCRRSFPAAGGENIN